jgi:AraC-like DNA-binding protein/mannose-6-phosphate isomerase-like protein (cupin superfamily)
MMISNFDKLTVPISGLDWSTLRAKFQPKSEMVDGHEVFRFNQNLENAHHVISRTLNMAVEPVQTYIPWHVHDYIEFSVVVKGECVFEFLDQTVTVTAGQVMLVDRRCAHRTKSLTKKDLVLEIGIRASLLQSIFLDAVPTQSILTDFVRQLFNKTAYAERYWQFDKVNQVTLVSIIQGLIEEYTGEASLVSELAQSFIQALLILLMQQSRTISHDQPHLNKYHAQPLDLILYIDEHYRDIGLSQMAAYFNYSPNYLSSELKKATGKVFSQLVQQKRVAVAKALLRQTNWPIEVIAERVGYENPVFFHKLFKREEQQTPAEYRQRTQSLNRT